MLGVYQTPWLKAEAGELERVHDGRGQQAAQFTLRDLIERQAMGPEACSFLRSQLEQTSDVLHKAFGVDRKTFYRWSKGHSAMPRPVWIVLARIILERAEGRSDTLNLLLDPRSSAA